MSRDEEKALREQLLPLDSGRKKEVCEVKWSSLCEEHSVVSLPHLRQVTAGLLPLSVLTTHNQ